MAAISGRDEGVAGKRRSSINVSLQDVVDAMDLPSGSWSAYLDCRTGEIVSFSEDQFRPTEDEALDHLPDWEREMVQKAREVEESDCFLKLPDKFDIHEWEIMRRFSDEREDLQQRAQLLDAIHGRGAFRHFQNTIRQVGIEEEWYRFRQESMEEIAKGWLREHNIPFK